MKFHNPPHPGETLKELCLEPLGITVTEAAEGLGVSRKTLSAIINGLRAVTRVATTKNESVLLNIAFHGTTWHVEQAVSAWRREQRLAALKRDNDRHDLRELRCYFDSDGFLVLKGRFTPDQGAIVQQALNAVMEHLLDERKKVSAETSAFEVPDPVKSYPQPMASRRADAMVRMAEAFLSGQSANCSADHFTINIHTDMETLKDDGAGAESQLENGPNVSAETSRRLCCDAGVVHWLEKKNGENGEIEPLSVGRKTRTVPPSIRRALQRRDRGCRFPGCSCSRYVDAHHIHHWADGGETSMENLVLLCRHHHRLLHEGGFSVRRLPAGRFVFANPAGKHIPEVAGARFRGNAFELMAANVEREIVITPKTVVPNWGGEGMDVDIVVHALQRLE
jgi:addiction module HigA family antidote